MKRLTFIKSENKIKIFFIALGLLTLLIMSTIDPFGDVFNSNFYSQHTAQQAPSIVYNNSSNSYLWNTDLNIYRDKAQTSITGVWSSGIFTDDKGNIFWTDSYGNVLIKWENVKRDFYYLASPYNYFHYAGSITGIAAVNFTEQNSTNISLIVLLTYYGYVFAYDITYSYWFNATFYWNLQLNNYPAPWTSVTSNVNGYNNSYDEGFFFTDLEGNTYFYDVTNPGYSEWYANSTTEKNIIATAAFYNRSLYGISYNGTVYVDLSNHTWGVYDNTGINDLIGITFDKNGYLYLLQLKNGTKLYKSSTSSGSIKGTFFPHGNEVSSEGTNAAITYVQQNNTFWIIQTNGTIAESHNTKNWKYVANMLFIEKYPTVLALNSTYSLDFYTYAVLNNYKNLTSILNFTLYFTGSNGKLETEYYYEFGTSKSLSDNAILDNASGVLINITLRPNMAYNSELNFYVYFYPQNEPNGSIIIYDLNITLINHFNYIPIG